MSTSPKFSATVVNPVSPTDNEGDPEGVNLNNFFSLMNKSGAYIFIPCRDIWPRASVDARLPPMPVLNKNGNPRRDSNGKIIYQPAISVSEWYLVSALRFSSTLRSLRDLPQKNEFTLGELATEQKLTTDFRITQRPPLLCRKTLRGIIMFSVISVSSC